MPTVTSSTNYAAAATITCTLSSLANASYQQSAVIDNTTNKYIDAFVSGSIQVGTSPTAGATIEIFAYGYDGNALYTAGCSGSNEAYTADGEEDELIYVTSITVDTTSDQDYVWGPVLLARKFGGCLPSKWGLVFKNSTGVTTHVTGTNNITRYQGVKFDNS
jgi:hypothetical protein